MFCPELYSRRSTHRRVWTGQDKEARACVCALWARWECAQGMGKEHLYSRRSTHRRVWTGQDGSELSDDRFTFVNARVISRFEFIKTTTREQSELRMGQSELRGVKANAHGSRRDQSHRKGDHTAFHVGGWGD